MQIDVIRAQHAALRTAVEALASPTEPAATRVTRAVAEVTRAFADAIPVWAAEHVVSIRTFTGVDPNAVGARVARLTPDELERIAVTVVELYTVGCREYWTA